jgi:hypothetical protein
MRFVNKYAAQVLRPVKEGEIGDVTIFAPRRWYHKLLGLNPVQGHYIITEEWEGHNDVVDVGAHKLLLDMFDSGTQSANWYLGLVNNSAFSAFSNDDTMSSHAGWTEYTGYTEGIRQEWEPDAPASRAIVNGTTVDFSINATATLRGAFLVDDDGDPTPTVGTLWATMEFTAPKAVDNGTVLRLTYTIEVAE